MVKLKEKVLNDYSVE
ncbi:Protein of unknown function [Lactobacillus delbrueckii subsp. lactis]|nr:Protein of unknown function [Lactobacillus delbrueckii subsp. lactis]